MSLPKSAVSLVKRPPVSCMPSPESPAKRIVNCSSCSTCLAISLHRSADDRDAPGLARSEQLVRIDVVAPAEEGPLGLALGGAVDRRPQLRPGLAPAALELREP